jgi:hypothetical protein
MVTASSVKRAARRVDGVGVVMVMSLQREARLGVVTGRALLLLMLMKWRSGGLDEGSEGEERPEDGLPDARRAVLAGDG